MPSPSEADAIANTVPDFRTGGHPIPWPPDRAGFESRLDIPGLSACSCVTTAWEHSDRSDLE